ncbi:Ig-like domain-containing protein [Kribbia dieselivorans]|uniref:Ig-like domain-containing protein n=1 Tax=Kribbia dieselivorans TaxID=331526 RepID=UPI00083885FD|nr:Ig-like domain-containing protein [Kribbia dieselivorans]
MKFVRLALVGALAVAPLTTAGVGAAHADLTSITGTTTDIDLHADHEHADHEHAAEFAQRESRGTDAVMPPLAARNAIADERQRIALADAARTSATTTTTTVSIYIAGTNSAVTRAGGRTKFNALVTNSITSLNATLKNTGVPVRAKLAGSSVVSGTDSTDLSAMLNQLRNPSDGKWDSVNKSAQRSGADLAYLFTGSANPQTCGVAYYPAGLAYGFGVVDQLCAVGNLSFAHEVGHNFGGAHDAAVGDQPFVQGARGYVNVAKRWRTVMAYNTACGTAYCDRLAVFSTPNLAYNGDPLGTTNADNSKAVRVWARTVANYRTPPKVSSRYPSSGAKGISRTPSIRVTFNETVRDVTSTRIKLQTKSGKAVSARLTKSTQRKNTWYLKPTRKLGASTTYRVRVSGSSLSGIRDRQDTPLKTTSWTFTTRR